jgi:ubiquinone/menaquinone biosynthesis C-methylase UbiE
MHAPDSEPAPTVLDDDQVVSAVRSHYADIAVRARTAGSAGEAPVTGCGCGGLCTPSGGTAFGAAVYAISDLEELPPGAVAGAQGCGNPTALARLHPGEVVLDLGSGGGIDVLLSARRVGPTGKAYGLDMTDEMLELARENQARAGVTNVEFMKGRIEDIPLDDASVDVILSNCVVNLSPDKAAVLAEAFRVLRTGGRLAISDVVIRDPEPGDADIPDTVRRDLTLWSGCVGGALQVGEYRERLAAAGFTDVEIEEVQRYTLQDLGGASGALTEAVAGRFVSAFVRARKA